MSQAIAKYRRHRDWADRQASRVAACHGGQIVCRPGCCDCCTNLTVFPVEYYSILDDLRQGSPEARARLVFDPAAGCGFLRDGRCQIYAVRPMICRTHGLPIAFVDPEADPSGDGVAHSVSFCPKNFTDADPADLDFGPDNTLDLDAINRELAEANFDFLAEGALGHADLKPTSRIPLARLVDEA